MNWLAEILPLAFIRWYSRKYISRMQVGNHLVTNPREGVFICVASQYSATDPAFIRQGECLRSPTETHAFSEHEGARLSNYKVKGLKACVWCGQFETIQMPGCESK